MNNQSDQLANTFLNEIKRRLFEENIPRLQKCLESLSTEQIWYRPNENSNSVGNLVLHLQGNVRQWIVSGLGGDPDIRERQKEFEEKGPLPTDQLVNNLDQTMSLVKTVLNNLKADQLLKINQVQGYHESGISILVHVTEHFSYHVGQITYIVKMLKDVDMNYYAGHDLNAKG